MNPIYVKYLFLSAQAFFLFFLLVHKRHPYVKVEMFPFGYWAMCSHRRITLYLMSLTRDLASLCPYLRQMYNIYIMILQIVYRVNFNSRIILKG